MRSAEEFYAIEKLQHFHFSASSGRLFTMRPPTTSLLLLSGRRSYPAWRHLPQCLRQMSGYQIDADSNPNPLIKVRSIPAPHTGLITILSLASPANRNAISQQLLRELSNAIDTVHDQWSSVGGSRNAVEEDSPGYTLMPGDISTSTRVLILSSEVEKVFCAGADLKERAGMSYDETNRFLTNLRGALGKLATLPIPTISAISGAALGGGLELALATTFRVLSTQAVVGLPETRLGIIPGAGGAVRLQNLIGSRKAADMILTGRRVGGRDGFAMGICERLVEELSPPEQGVDLTLETAVNMAKEICEGGPIAIGAAMKIVGQGIGNNGHAAKLEEMMYENVINTTDRNEALRAFKEKRKPKFVGR